MASSNHRTRGRGRSLGTSTSIPDIVDRERGHREREQRKQAEQRHSRTLDAKLGSEHRGKMKLDRSVLQTLQGPRGPREPGRGGGPREPGRGGSPQPGTSRGEGGRHASLPPGGARSSAGGRTGGHAAGQISEPVTRVTVSMAAASSAPRTSQSHNTTRTTSTSPTPVVLQSVRSMAEPGPSPAPPPQQQQPRPMSIASEGSVSINVSDERQLLPTRSRNSVVLGHDNAHLSAGAAADQAQINTSAINPGVSLNRYETNEALPDILNSHLLPPYTSHRQNQSRSARQQNTGRGGGRPDGRSNRQGRSGNARRASRPPPGPVTQLEDPAKRCCTRDTCLDCVTVVTTFRWVLVTLAMLGVCCVVTGIILGALHMTIGNSFLTLSLMFIGLGVMLVVVVGVGWRCTPHGHEPCHLLFNLGDHSSRTPSRGHRSHRPHRDRNGWYGGVLYPEFRHRRPPPSYNASMQEYQQQMILAQIQQSQPGQQDGGGGSDNLSLPSSPPPTYRSRASSTRPGLHITFPLADNTSRPPTYRSHVSDDGGAPCRSRPALPMSDSASTSDDNAVSPHSVHVTIESHAGGGRGLPSTSSLSTAATSQHATPPRGPEDSTLHRAAAVVQYLDNILRSEGADSTDTTSRSNTPSASTSRKPSEERDSPAVPPPASTAPPAATAATGDDAHTDATSAAENNEKGGEGGVDDDELEQIADTPL